MTTETNYMLQSQPKRRGVLTLDLDPRELLVLLAFCEKNIVRYALYALSLLPAIGRLSELVLPILYSVLIILSFNKAGKKFYLLETVVFLTAVIAITISCLLYPQNAKYILNENNFWNSIFPCLRWYFVGLAMLPNRKTMDLIGKASCIAILIESAYVLLYMIPRGILGTDEMSRAYLLLPNILIVTSYAFDKRKASVWFCLGVGTVFLLSMGTRGALVVMLAYFLIKFLMTTATKMSTRITVTILLLTVGLWFIGSEPYIAFLKSLKPLFKGMGLSTRIIDFAIEGTTFSYTSGRDQIFEIAKKRILEKPFVGYGVYGDWPMFNWNVHNMYLEALIYFGLILGSMLLIWIVCTTFKPYFKTTNPVSKDIILMFACFVFIRGVYGGMMLNFNTFFMLAFCIKEQRRVRNGQMSFDTT